MHHSWHVNYGCGLQFTLLLKRHPHSVLYTLVLWRNDKLVAYIYDLPDYKVFPSAFELSREETTESLAPNPLSVISHSNALCVSSTVVIDRRTGRLEAHTMNTSANDCLVDYLLSDQRGFPCPAEFSNLSYSRLQLPQNPYAQPFTSSRAQSRTHAPTTRPHSTCHSPPLLHRRSESGQKGVPSFWCCQETCPACLLSRTQRVSHIPAVHSNSSSRASARAPHRPTALPRVLTQTQHDTNY